MPCSYYIYYRIDPAKTAVSKARIRELLDAVRKTTGVAGRLATKRDEKNLWMEIYEHVADDAKFELELAEAVSRLKVLELLLPGTPRHIEVFEDA